MIARRTLACCASKPLIALASRTDHNPATPSLSLMPAPELSTAAIALAAITQLRDDGGATGVVKPAARQGRSEAEWLDRSEDRRTIRRRDGRDVVRHDPAQPSGAAPGGEVGGSKDGVAHAQVVALLGCDSGADSGTGGTKRRRRQPEAVDWQDHRA